MDINKISNNTPDPANNDHLQDPEKAVSKAISPGPLQKTITAQDWNGPEDPENPLNW